MYRLLGEIFTWLRRIIWIVEPIKWRKSCGVTMETKKLLAAAWFLRQNEALPQRTHKRISQDKCLGCIYVFSTILEFHLFPCGGNGKGGSSEDTLLHWPILYTYRIFFFVLYSPRIAFANCGHKLCKVYLIWNKKTCCVVLLLCSLSQKVSENRFSTCTDVHGSRLECYSWGKGHIQQY